MAIAEGLVNELKKQTANTLNNDQQFEYFINRIQGFTQAESLDKAGYSPNSTNIANRIDARPLIAKLYKQYKQMHATALQTDVHKMNKKEYLELYSHGLVKLTAKEVWDKDDHKEFRMYLQEVGKLKGFIEGEKKGDTFIFNGENKIEFMAKGIEKYIRRKEFDKAKATVRLLYHEDRKEAARYKEMVDKEIETINKMQIVNVEEAEIIEETTK